MADMVQTPASVAAGSGASYDSGLAGETIVAGNSLYRDPADSRMKLTDVNVAGKDICAGMAVNGAANGQPVQFQTGGNINPGGTVVIGTIYVVSATAGGIAPSVDGVTGWKTSIFGIGTTATNIKMSLNAGQAAIP